MLFNSLHFLWFFIAVTAGYFVLPFKQRWWWLLGASCGFYMAFVPIYILILGFTIIVDYCAGIFLEKTTGRTKRAWLLASLAANIGVLAAFKYWNWLNDNLALALQNFGIPESPLPYLHILLPIGLSFHTFQAISYTVEVYRGNFKAEKHIGIYALYVMFYPQLVAGPIERPQNVLPQFRQHFKWNSARVKSGLLLMAWGLFKKVAVADRLALIANAYYDHPHDYYGISGCLATIAFAFQIYCDFSGYSDIALGSAEVMGFTLMRNFNRPYFSKSIAEFWTRWHISLSSWFRDYVYIPLGGNRVSKPRYYFNLMITFLLSGLWHGASWNFVIWGGTNGTYQIGEALTFHNRIKGWHTLGLGPKHPVRQWIGAATTFFLICVTWVFFRANTFADALYTLKASLLPTSFMDSIQKPTYWALNQNSLTWTKALIALVLLLVVEWQQRRGSVRKQLSDYPQAEALLTTGLVLGILLLGNMYAANQFIYFQF